MLDEVVGHHVRVSRAQRRPFSFRGSLARERRREDQLKNAGRTETHARAVGFSFDIDIDFRQ